MPPYQHLLVPRDYSATSEAALLHAAELARMLGADLDLLHAEVLHSDPAAVREGEARALSADAVRQRVGEGSTVRTATVRDVAAAPAIVRYAEEHAVDLIVMGTHGRRGVRRWLLGSVTEEVVRAAPCAVLAARAESPALDAGPVIVPVDFSSSSRHALERGHALAELFRTGLHAVHVAHVAPYPSFYGTDVVSQYDLPPHFVEEAARQLHAFVQGTLGRAAVFEAPVLVGEPFRLIAGYAGEQRAGLLVMGRRGLSGLQQVLLGSTTERTIRLAPCPVLVTRVPPGTPLGPVV